MIRTTSLDQYTGIFVDEVCVHLDGRGLGWQWGKVLPTVGGSIIMLRFIAKCNTKAGASKTWISCLQEVGCRVDAASSLISAQSEYSNCRYAALSWIRVHHGWLAFSPSEDEASWPGHHWAFHCLHTPLFRPVSSTQRPARYLEWPGWYGYALL